MYVRRYNTNQQDYLKFSGINLMCQQAAHQETTQCSLLPDC